MIALVTGQQAATQLQRDPLPPRFLRKAPGEGGVPALSGIYAWWMLPGSLPGISGPPHPTADLELLYVGIAPARASSKATIRSRICGQHLGGNIGSSTFRLSLAALLADRQRWCAEWSGSRARLTREDNDALSGWQRQHLRLRWAEVPQPWLIEHEVIDLMRPPLNLAGNEGHPFGAALSEARSRLKEAGYE